MLFPKYQNKKTIQNKQNKHTLQVVIHINKKSYQTTKNYNIHQKLKVKTKSNLSPVLYISIFPMGLGHEAAIRGGLGSGLDGVQHLADVSLLLLQQVLQPSSLIVKSHSEHLLQGFCNSWIYKSNIILLTIQWACIKKVFNQI